MCLPGLGPARCGVILVSSGQADIFTTEITESTEDWKEYGFASNLLFYSVFSVSSVVNISV